MKIHPRVVKINKLKRRWYKNLDRLHKMRRDIKISPQNAPLKSKYRSLLNYNNELNNKINKLEKLHFLNTGEKL